MLVLYPIQMVLIKLYEVDGILTFVYKHVWIFERSSLFIFRYRVNFAQIT
ncbi:MAG: hypothetical protein ACI82Z_001605 [Cellvibrionaceae bacterium]|jgi:hypothetical protein